VTYYLCGPMSGIPDFNYPAFEIAAKLLRSSGFTIISPHENFPPDGAESWENYMRTDIGSLVTCDGIILLDGWTKSRGAQLEAMLALNLGLRALTFYRDRVLTELDSGRII